MNLPALVRIPLALTVISVLTACGLVGAPPTASPVPSQAPASIPAPTLPPTSPPATATPTTAPPTQGSDLPPAATLNGDGTAVVGHLGSYCYMDICADELESPPKAQLPELASGGASSLTFEVGEPVEFVAWRASSSAESAGAVTELGSGGQGFDPDASPATPWPLTDTVSFPSPPAGDWLVRVQVFLEGGDLSYAWHVTVP